MMLRYSMLFTAASMRRLAKSPPFSWTLPINEIYNPSIGINSDQNFKLNNASEARLELSKIQLARPANWDHKSFPGTLITN